jgi:hypothetical protein
MHAAAPVVAAVVVVVVVVVMLTRTNERELVVAAALECLSFLSILEHSKPVAAAASDSRWNFFSLNCQQQLDEISGMQLESCWRWLPPTTTTSRGIYKRMNMTSKYFDESSRGFFFFFFFFFFFSRCILLHSFHNSNNVHKKKAPEQK